VIALHRFLKKLSFYIATQSFIIIKQDHFMHPNKIIKNWSQFVLIFLF